MFFSFSQTVLTSGESVNVCKAFAGIVFFSYFCRKSVIRFENRYYEDRRQGEVSQ